MKNIITAFLAFFIASSLSAQLTIGEWQSYPAFQGGAVKSVVATPSKVYFVSGINLFSYDPSTEESVHYTADNFLNDSMVATCYYNSDKDYLLVVYSNANIDIIKRDGSVVNIPDILNARITGDRAVNDVAFADGKIYIATDFGLVVVNDSDFRVALSGQYRGGAKHIPSGGPDKIAIMGDKLMGVWGKDLYESLPADNSRTYREAEKFKYVGTLPVGGVKQMLADGDKALVLRVPNGTSNVVDRVHRINFPIATSGSNINVVDYPHTVSMPLWVDGDVIYGVAVGALVRINGNEIQGIKALPSDISRLRMATSRADKRQMWYVTPEGLSCYDMTADVPTRTKGPHRPQANSVYNVSLFSTSPDGERIYTTTRASSFNWLSASGTMAEPLQKEIGSPIPYGIWTPGFIDVITEDGVEPLDIDIRHLTGRNGEGYTFTVNINNRYGTTIGPIMSIAENPTNPDQIWIATLNEGLYRVEKGVTTALFSGQLNSSALQGAPLYDNAPWAGMFMQLIHDVKFDSQGNLWVLVANDDMATSIDTHTAPQLVMLPAKYVSAPFSTIKKEHWLSSRRGTNLIPATMNVSWDGKMVMLKRSPVIAIRGPRADDNHLVLYRTAGTPGDVSDDSYAIIKDVIDQDGNRIDVQGISTIAETPSGGLFVSCWGTNFIIPSPATFNPSTNAVKRLKVARNDGSGTADYLMNGEVISDVQFDTAGRMWLATEGSGITVVSAAFDEIEETYNKDNSPLPTNNISALAISPISNRVYAGSRYGLSEFASDQSPEQDSYSDVRAYPNPVRPDYRGLITIDGLMGNSMVKITDAMGATVWTGYSKGGMARWDGNDMNGRPVKSGVYMVIPSQMEDGGNKGKVATKILVVR